VSAARNLALQVATRRLLAVTDDDCVPDDRWIEALVAAFHREPAPSAVTGSILPPSGPQPPEMHTVSPRASANAQDLRGRILPWRAGSGGNFAAPVELLRSIGGWDPRLGPGTGGRAAEDIELLYRMLSAGLTMRYEPRAVVRHEWQSRDRRLSTRWSYGFGMAAMCGILLRRGDAFALRILASYTRMHLVSFGRAAVSRRAPLVVEHGRALVSLPGGLAYGLRARPMPGAVVTAGTPTSV
jgi:Glycosyltransferase like family 2